MRNFKNLLILAGLLTVVLLAPLFAQTSMTRTIISVSGRIFDEISRRPVGVEIIVTDEKGKKVFQTKSLPQENGSYFVTSLKPGQSYTFTLKQDSYFTEMYQLQMPNSEKYIELSRDFLVMPLNRGVKFPMNVPPFELNKSKPKVGYEFLLEEWKNALLHNPGVKVKIVCYPDNNNSPEENIKLTEERAAALKNYFVSKGISVSRISVEGTRSADPANPPPPHKAAKGKRYIGSTYLIIEDY